MELKYFTSTVIPNSAYKGNRERREITEYTVQGMMNKLQTEAVQHANTGDSLEYTIKVFTENRHGVRVNGSITANNLR